MGRCIWKKKTVIVCSSILILMCLVTMLAPVLAPYDPFAADTSQRLLPPSTSYWLGTDHLGRDLFSRLLYGAQYSFFGAIVVSIIVTVISVVIGMIAGYKGGWLDQLFMRFSEWMLAFPSLMIAFVLVGILGPGMWNLMLALILVFWMPGARLVRNMVVRLKNERFVQVAKLHGLSSFRIILRHLLPFVLPQVLVLATLDVGSVLLHIAAFSFLGLGIEPPLPEWGAMLNDSRNYFYSAPWLMIFPGLIIFMIVLSLHLLSDHWRDMFHIKKQG